MRALAHDAQARRSERSAWCSLDSILIHGARTNAACRRQLPHAWLVDRRPVASAHHHAFHTAQHAAHRQRPYAQLGKQRRLLDLGDKWRYSVMCPVIRCGVTLSTLNTRPLNMRPAPPAATRRLAACHSPSTSLSTTSGSCGMARPTAPRHPSPSRARRTRPPPFLLVRACR